MSDPVNHDQPTTFDALLEKMKRDVEEMESAPAPASGAAAKLKAIFDAALAEASSIKETAAHRLHESADKAREQVKAHPVTTISAAFAAGYMIGKSIVGRVKR